MAIYQTKPINPATAYQLIDKFNRAKTANDVYRIILKYLGNRFIPLQVYYNNRYGVIGFNNTRQEFEIFDIFVKKKPKKVNLKTVKSYYQNQLLTLIPAPYLYYRRRKH